MSSGILKPEWGLSDRDPTQPPWTEAEEKAWLLRCMEVYATQEDIEDGVVLVENIPSGYEVDFNTGAYRKILKREPLYKMRMRLFIPEYPEFEALSAKPEGEPLPRLA